MGNVKAEAKHYEQALLEMKREFTQLPKYPAVIKYMADWLEQRARELAQAEQEKQE